MITNERQAGITRAKMKRLQESFEQSKANASVEDPRLQRAILAGIQSQIRDLRRELESYESQKELDADIIEVRELHEIPALLINARIARGLTQAELARLLEMKEQQIQRYEATRYRSASLSRILQIAEVLGVDLTNVARFSIRRLAPREFFRRCMERGDLSSPTQLIDIASNQVSRKELADKCNVPEKMITQWASQSELLQLHGLGEGYLTLLDEAGINSVEKLSNWKPAQLYNYIAAINISSNVVARMPDKKKVRNWVREARRVENAVME